MKFLSLAKGECVEGSGYGHEDTCSGDMLVLTRWQGRTMAVPLSRLTALHPDKATCEAVKDWHYWLTIPYVDYETDTPPHYL
jgi:Calcium binding